MCTCVLSSLNQLATCFCGGAVLASDLTAYHLALLVTDLALGPLVAEDLNLAVGAVQQDLVVVVTTAVGVNLQVEGETLHPLLWGEVCAQTVHRHIDLMRTKTQKREKWMKTDKKLQ